MEDIIYCCKLRDESESFDLVPELLAAYGYEFSTWRDDPENFAYHTVYCESKAEAEEVHDQVTANLRDWADYGAKIVAIETFSLRKEDWAEVWKKYFKILPISERLVIKPSWLDYDPGFDQVIVEIDPGMSFGTGQHATTAYCLKMIDQLSDNPEINSFLDAGCGSGILSVAASMLEYDPIMAFDIDPEAIMVAAENIEKNLIIGDAIDLRVTDVANFESGESGGYDLVAANILAHVLFANREKIASCVRPDGYLILAGILSSEFQNISAGFSELGFQLDDSFTDKEWTSGLFSRI